MCKDFLQANVSAIVYLVNYETFGRSTASAQYFLQLAGYLGIPVVSWNADNSGLERTASQSRLQIQLAPSIEHQSAAMLSILERYKWHQFSIVTSQIAGHDDFVQALRERVNAMTEHFKFTILNSIIVTRASDLMELVNSESRIMLLYCTKGEAVDILQWADELKITGEKYVWVVTQSVIENTQAPPQFPVGMLGVHFDTSSQSVINEISTAMKVYALGVQSYLNDPANAGRKLNTAFLSCEVEGKSRWENGEIFYRHLRNVSLETDINKPNIEFTADGDLKNTELKIMNLRPSGNSKSLVWEEVLTFVISIGMDFVLKKIFVFFEDWNMEIMGASKIGYPRHCLAGKFTRSTTRCSREISHENFIFGRSSIYKFVAAGSGQWKMLDGTRCFVSSCCRK